MAYRALSAKFVAVSLLFISTFGISLGLVATMTSSPVGATSSGISWTASSNVPSGAWDGISYGNGIFVAVSWSGTNSVMRSSDGITWTAVAGAPSGKFQEVTFGNGIFVAVGDQIEMYSTDGTTWTTVTDSVVTSGDWYSVTCGNGTFVAVSSDGTAMYSGSIQQNPDQGITRYKNRWLQI